MSIQIGGKLSPTFQQPLELLADCHRRIERFLGDLILVTERARGGELKSVEREALETALRYFREAAPKHVADEEESLFPRLRLSDSDFARSALAAVERLESDHQAVRHDHDAVEELGTRWLNTGMLSAADTDELLRRLHRLRSTYEGHIAVEDREVFPAAARALDPTALVEMGREMAARRIRRQE